MRRVFPFILILSCFVTLAASPAAAEGFAGTTGMRVGLGTDVSGGIAYGAQLDYTLDKGENAFELGLTVFGGHFEEDSNNGYNDYHEETDVVVIGAIGNYLFRYASPAGGPYFILGAGVGAFSVDWTESSPTDSSLGPPLPDGGSYQSEDGTSAGFIMNFGIGAHLGEKTDIRVAVPTFIIGAGDERGSAVVPTLTVTLGFKF